MDYCSINNHKYNKIFLKIFALYLGFSQIINILRVTNIYNSIILVNYVLLFISTFFIINFILFFNKFKVGFCEVFLIFIPFFYSFVGLALNGFSRDILADTYNAIIVIMAYIYIENCDFVKYENEFEFLVNVIFYTSIIYKIIIILCPYIGIKVISVAKIIYISVLPLLYFYITNKKIKTFISFILIITGGKRSLLVAIIGLIVIQIFLNKKIKFKKKIIMLILILIVVFGILYFSLSLDKISLLPDFLEPMFVKIMKINPLSKYSNILSDFRIIEIISSLRPLLENKILLITGHGAGYTYDVLIDGIVTQSNRHNVHFSPVSIYTKYGLLYVLLYYGVVLNIIRKSISSKNLNYLEKVMLLYAIVAVINSMFEFTLYTDYMFIISLGILSSRIRKNYIKRHGI